jgi:hypothetical protein
MRIVRDYRAVLDWPARRMRRAGRETHHTYQGGGGEQCRGNRRGDCHG